MRFSNYIQRLNQRPTKTTVTRHRTRAIRWKNLILDTIRVCIFSHAFWKIVAIRFKVYAQTLLDVFFAYPYCPSFIISKIFNLIRKKRDIHVREDLKNTSRIKKINAPRRNCNVRQLFFCASVCFRIVFSSWTRQQSSRGKKDNYSRKQSGIASFCPRDIRTESDGCAPACLSSE